MPYGLILPLFMAPAGGSWSVDLGEVNQSHGLAVPSQGDGTNRLVTRGGRVAREVAWPDSDYLYVQIDDEALFDGEFSVWLTVELWDDAPGLLNVEYDAVGEEINLGTRYRPASPILLVGSGQWVRRTIQITGARFANGQNWGSDLRLNGRATVSRIELSTTAPADWDPNRPLPREELERWRTRIGEGMQLTIGNDVTDGTAMLYELLGVTAVESYVTWQTVEDAGRGEWDWSQWDEQVEILERHGLQWVPFLIAGPAYATPKWFREGPQHHAYVCLEHGQASKVKSLWNPLLRPEIERFLAAFAERYRDRGVIQSVLLGITGIYGESIYPAGPEGGWTENLPGPYHNHGGWWAGDSLAIAAFRAAMSERYETIADLNGAWRTEFRSFDEVSTFHPELAPSPAARADFVRWYEEEMTEWSRWWVEATRRAFPATPILLCTGGDGAPYLGADFTAQAKAIAPYGAGIRITNEGSDYAANYAVTREVATATRLYGTWCGFEPASTVSPEGVAARLYNATASGARELHYYAPNIFASHEAIEVFRRSAEQLQVRRPAVPTVAVYLPRAAWAQDGGRVGESYRLVRQLRELVDLDLVNRTSVLDGVLAETRLLMIPHAPELEPDAAAAIDDWVRAGGVVTRQVGDVPEGLLSVETTRPIAARWRLHVGAEGDRPFLDGDWWLPESGAEFPAEGARKRWSGAAPGVWLPVEPGRPVVLEVEALLRQESLPDGADCKVKLDGRLLGTLHVGHGVYRYELTAEQVTRTPARLSFEPRTWRPSDYDIRDDRDLGVMLHRVELIRDPAAEVVLNRGIEQRVDWAKVPVETLGAGRVIRLPANPDDEAWQLLLPGLLGGKQRRLGLPRLLEDEAFDRIFVTRLGEGRLWLNMTAESVERGGVRLAPYSVGWSE